MNQTAAPYAWEHPKPVWIVVLILAFLSNWVIGLLVFTALLLAGKLDGWKRGFTGFWNDTTSSMRGAGTWWQPRSSGNHAFDDYRLETLRRLEDEEREFREFLERLRAAKDRSEFDQFMAERRNRQGHDAAQPSAT